MQNVAYTIIIPHKNIPDLLQRCLATIPQRGDVQVIVVDDNSNPDIVDFAHFPGLDRADVECYFTKEGKGAGYARNVGLQHARGKWLLFADADDFFHSNLLEKLDPWKDSTRDIIYFETDSVDSETLEIVASRLHIHTSQISREEMENNAAWVYPVGKMIRTELVKRHNILFDEIRWSNDVMFSARCSYHAARNIDISNEFLYCATICENSLTTKKLTEESVMCRLNVSLRFERYLHNHKMSYTSSAGDGVSNSFYWMRTMRNVSKDSFKKAKIFYLKHVCVHVLISDLNKFYHFGLGILAYYIIYVRLLLKNAIIKLRS